MVRVNISKNIQRQININFYESTRPNIIPYNEFNKDIDKTPRIKKKMDPIAFQVYDFEFLYFNY